MITTPYSDTSNLQPLLSTTIHTEADGCVIASLSGQVRITDNFVVFQVRIDGVPLQGQSPLTGFTTPVVFVAIDAASNVNEDEQLIDPTKAVAFNFFGDSPEALTSWKSWAQVAAPSPLRTRQPRHISRPPLRIGSGGSETSRWEDP